MNNFGFDVLTEVTVSFWDVLLCSLVEVQQRFGAVLAISFLFFAWLCGPENGGSTCLRNIAGLV
jgi:ABC-type multidrug transport system permease subunit